MSLYSSGNIVKFHMGSPKMASNEQVCAHQK